jgi:hypothetical protein
MGASARIENEFFIAQIGRATKTFFAKRSAEGLAVPASKRPRRLHGNKLFAPLSFVLASVSEHQLAQAEELSK